MLVLAGGQDGFTGNGDHFKSCFFKELLQRGGGEGGQLELFGLVACKPSGFAGAYEGFQSVEVAALDIVIQCGQFVVGRCDDDAVWLGDTEHFTRGGHGVATDGKGIAHGNDQREGRIREHRHVDDVAGEQRGLFAA